MKTIADAAMAAISAGEAIVTAAVEIVPYGNAAVLNVPGTGIVGTAYPFSGYATTDVVSLTKPTAASDSRLSWDAFSAWPNDSYNGANSPPVIGRTWQNSFSVYGNNGGADVLLFQPTLDPNLYLTAADAYAGLAANLPHALTGYSTYKIVVGNDPNPTDNRGGLSLLLTSAPSAIRVWGGYGNLTIGGAPYRGIGGRGFAQKSAGSLSGAAQGLTIGVSGVEAAALELLDGEELRGASVTVKRLIFSPDGKTLLDAHVFDRGRIDTVATDETIGSTAAINVSVESAARGLGRSGARMRADADQRLISATDGYFKNTAYAGQKDLYWGGTRPIRTGSAGGAGPVAGGSGGTGSGFSGNVV